MKELLFFNYVFSRYFRYWNDLQKSAESNFFRGRSEENIVLGVINEGSADVGNIF